MKSNSRLILTRLCSVVALAVIIFASFLPAQLERLGTGHWDIEQLLAYFAATSIVCLGWRRPFVVAGSLMAAAAVLEALEGLTPNQHAQASVRSQRSWRSVSGGATCHVHNPSTESADLLPTWTFTLKATGDRHHAYLLAILVRSFPFAIAGPAPCPLDLHDASGGPSSISRASSSLVMDRYGFSERERNCMRPRC
jgi:hypothetical protein